MKKQLRKLSSQVSGTLGNKMVESPTLMDRWRITVLGKPVLSLPIKQPSEYPSNWSEGVWQQGKREKLVFQSVEEGSVQFCSVLKKRILKSTAETSLFRCTNGSRYLIHCIKKNFWEGFYCLLGVPWVKHLEVLFLGFCVLPAAFTFWAFSSFPRDKVQSCK